jgi:hypothetical protein
MRRFSVIERGAPLVGLLLVAAQLVTCGSSSATACKVADECWSAPETEDLGRCGPKEVACLADRCRVDCAQLCEVVEALVNPCRNPAQVCNQSKSGKEGSPYCASGPIACESVDDCPLSIPTGSANDAWTCENKVCRLPGFEYAWR